MNGKYEYGKRDGRLWAKTADTDDLERLEEVVEATDWGLSNNRSGTAGSFVGVANNGMNRGSAVAIFEAIQGDDGPTDHTEVADFWDGVIWLGKRWAKIANDDDYATGFVEACLDELASRATASEFTSGLSS